MPELAIGQSVVVRLNPTIKKWTRGKIASQEKDRAYTVIRPYVIYENTQQYVPVVPQNDQSQEASPAQVQPSHTVDREHFSINEGENQKQSRYPQRSNRGQLPKRLADFEMDTQI